MSVPFSALFLSTLAVSVAPRLVDDDSGPQTAVAEQRDVADEVELDGVFVPVDAEEVAFWPEAYRGELLFLEVVPHGSYVNAGDEIARFSLRTIERELDDAQRELASLVLAHSGKAEKARLATEAEAAALGGKRAGLARAERDLAGWEKHELDFKQRSNELSAKNIQHNIEDQEDELAQLEAMYRDDELVDATEEIVLKRARRRLATSRTGQRLSLERRAYDMNYDVQSATETKRETVGRMRGELDRLVRTQAVDQESREDALRTSSRSVEKLERRAGELARDRAGMVLRAPRDGVLLHGGLAAYGVGKARPEHRYGKPGAPREPLFCIADPDRLAVAVEVSESQLASVRSGAAGEVSAVVIPDKSFVGALALERYPTPASASGPEGRYSGRVDLDGRQAGLVVGMRATVRLRTEMLEDVVVVPRAAVFGDGDEAHCWAENGQSFVRTSLTLGPRKPDEVVIRTGLAAGVRVLLSAPPE